MYCNDSHGISVGSLGHHIGQVDIVENILVCNTSLKLRYVICHHVPRAGGRSWLVRLESKSGLEQLATPTSTGGSSGWDRNVTYEGMHNYNNDWAIKMTQFYVAPNQTACNEHPVWFASWTYRLGWSVLGFAYCRVYYVHEF